MKHTDDSTIKRMLTTAPMKRLTRPENPQQRFTITDRDIAMVRFVDRVGSASSDQVARFAGGSVKNVGNRLKLLFFFGYLDRPLQQRTHLSAFFDRGNAPLIYSLGRTGARLLADLGDPINAHLSWSLKNARATAPFLAHRIETTAFVLHLILACRAASAPRLLDHHEQLAFFPEKTRESADPYRLRVTIPSGAFNKPLSVSVVPDRLVSLAYGDNTRHNFACEIDRGSMPVKSKSIAGRSNYRRKLATYYHAHLQDCHTTQWGFQGFRVLTIAPSEARIAHMIAAQREVTNDRLTGLFLYSTPQRLDESGALAPIWMTSERDGVSLLDRK